MGQSGTGQRECLIRAVHGGSQEAVTASPEASFGTTENGGIEFGTVYKLTPTGHDVAPGC